MAQQYTAQQIADAYRDTVGAGTMTEAQFVQAAADLGITQGQLLAGAQTITGVAPDITALPQQEVINYLRASTPGQAQITPFSDPNAPGAVTSGMGPNNQLYRAVYSGGAGEGESPTLRGYEGFLTREFDPTYQGGQFGSYVGIYDPQGNLVDIQFRQQERSGGFISENLDWIGPLAVGGAALAGATLGAGALGSTLGGADLVGSDWALGQATGPAGGLLPVTEGGLTAANLGASSGGVDLVGSDWALGQATGPTGGLLPVGEGGLTLANTQATPGPYTGTPAGGTPVGPTGPGGGTPIVPTGPGGGTPTIPGLGNVGGLGIGDLLGLLGTAYGGTQAAEAAREAAQIQAQLGREGLALQREMFERQIGLQEPFRQAGMGAQNRLLDLLGIGYSPEQLAQEYRSRVGTGQMSEAQFVQWARSQGIPDQRLMQARNMLLGQTTGMGAPQSDFGSAARPFSMEAFQQDPGYGFRLGEGLKALERSAAARGGLLSGGTGKALQRYGQEAASQEYGNAFNRFYTERQNLLNPLLSLSGRGQTVSSELGQQAGQFGQAGANQLGQIGNVMASGTVGSTNAINQAIGQGVSIYNNAQNRNMLGQLYGMR